MPHLSLQYSGNVGDSVDIEALCRVLHGAILATGTFELGAIRVRAFRADEVAIADLDPRNAFVHMSFRIGVGRSRAEIKAAGEAIFSAASAFLSPLLTEPYFALSFDIEEINAEWSWKKNAIHPRIRRAAT